MNQLRTAVILACAWSAIPFVPVEAQLTQRIDELVDTIRNEFQADEALTGVAVTGGEIVPRRLAVGHDLRLVAEGGTLEQRVLASNAVRSILQNDPEWRTWLEVNGAVTTWYDVPADFDLLTVIPATSEESAKIQSLLETVQDQVELDPELAGVLVQSAHLARRLDGDRPGRELHIYGRVVDSEQADRLVGVFLDAMAADPYWIERRGEIFVAFRTLDVTLLSPVFAQRYYAMGLNLFWKCRFLEADAAFMRAVAEDPASPIYRYWRVVTLLALGHTTRAEARLRPLLHQDPWGQFSAVIALELERVQGPLRWQLQALEQHVLLTLEP